MVEGWRREEVGDGERWSLQGGKTAFELSGDLEDEYNKDKLEF